MAQVIVFDVNETLLDTHALAPQFRRIFGSVFSVAEWFAKVVQYSMATSLAGDYRAFGDIATSVLRMEAAARHVELEAEDIEAVRDAMTQMPAYPDVRRALERLREGGHRLAVLSNSAADTLELQLLNAGLRGYFEQALSVSEVRVFKPSPDVYRAAARSLRIGPGQMLMVATHAWDLLGASRAGCATAFIARSGKAPLPGVPAPDYVAGDLGELADQLVGPERTRAASAFGVAAAGASVALGSALGVLAYRSLKKKQRSGVTPIQ